MRHAPPHHAVRIRGLAIFHLVLFAAGALLYTPFAWYMNRTFTLDGVKTGTGRVVEKRAVKRIDGEDLRTDYFLDIEYEDGQSVTHRHARKAWESEWKRHNVGVLPGVEFLRGQPHTYRMPGEYTWWYLAPPLSLGAMALAGRRRLRLRRWPLAGPG